MSQFWFQFLCSDGITEQPKQHRNGPTNAICWHTTLQRGDGFRAMAHVARTSSYQLTKSHGKMKILSKQMLTKISFHSPPHTQHEQSWVFEVESLSIASKAAPQLRVHLRQTILQCDKKSLLCAIRSCCCCCWVGLGCVKSIPWVLPVTRKKL